MSSSPVFSDEMWARVEPLLPPLQGPMGRPMREHRQVIEGIAFRYRVGCPWRDVPDEFGPHQTLWRRHDRWSSDGTWDRIMAVLIEQADAVGVVDWTVSADSTISRAHQQAATLPRTEVRPAHREVVVAGGRSLKRPLDLQQSARRAG